MKVLKRILIALISLLLIVLIGGYVYLLTTAPTYSGEITLRGLHADVEVLYDNYGVPHIYAQNEEDAYYALGYVHAQDRLFQMEMLRRAAGGRLSEILGEDLLKVDKLFRTLGINQFAKEHAQKFLSADTAAFQKAALAYQKGINQFIKTGKTPIEFTIIGIPKEEFKPEDIYLAAGFMAFGFAEGLRVDPILQKIKTEYGEEYLVDFDINMVTGTERIKNFKGQAKNTASADSLIAYLDEAISKIPVPLWSGSNSWVVSSKKSASGYPILELDAHIGFGQPAVWYEAHLEYPGFSFYGHHLAGIPFGIFGNNKFAGWGMTMFENDDTDFFLETVNPENKNQVKFRDQWEDLDTRKEIIKVKGKSDVELEVRSSRHGVLINGILDYAPTDQAVAFSWTITRTTNRAMDALYLLDHSKSFRDVQTAASLWAAPGLNLMYGDVEGNIAWWACAKLPIRAEHARTKLFLDGASGKDEYLGFYDFTKNPSSVNPPWEYVYSSNNQPDSVDDVLYPGYYSPKNRAAKIIEHLNRDKKFTLDDMKEINLNVVSGTAPEVAREIAKVLGALNKSEYAPMIELLQEWDGNHKQMDTAPSVYYTILSQIYYLGMKDELGAEALKSILSTHEAKSAVGLFIKNDNSPWWDDIRTKETKETRSMIFEKAATKTLSLLSKNCGAKPEQWAWGKIHMLKHKHALGAVNLLDKFFSVGPYPVDGGLEVLNNLSFDLDTLGYFNVTFGPSLRKITDFSDIENGETVSPTGQSGNVMSPFYADQAEMFATGKFRKMLMNRTEIEKVSKNKLVLKPAL